MTGVAPPPREDLGLLALAVACVSSAPPLIAATAAPALAIAFWRTGIGALALLPFVLGRRRAEVRRASRGTIALAVFGGTMLAAHFSAFVPSLRLTSVASAAALVCSQAVWAGVFGRMLGERLPPRAWAGTAVALAGVVTVTGVDMSLSARALGGDVLALLGGFFGGAYIVTGGLARRRLTTSAYIAVCYSTSALLLLAVCVIADRRLGGYAAADWVRILGIAVLAQLLGHSLFNHVLRSTSPTLVSLATLFTVPLAAVFAATTLGQTPPAAAVPALALLLAGTALVITAGEPRAVARS